MALLQSLEERKAGELNPNPVMEDSRGYKPVKEHQFLAFQQTNSPSPPGRVFFCFAFVISHIKIDVKGSTSFL
jgi:hypothetical protein